jgi:surface protein
MFENCDELTDIEGLSRWNTSNVTDMSYMFNYSDDLIDISSLS